MSVPPAGAVIAGKYALGKRLGTGGYGSVFEGENLDLGKKVAIKLIDRRKKSSAETVARFRREARLTGKIESPHIVQIFDVGEDETFGLFLVMELLRGEDLRHKLDRVGRLAVEPAVDFAHQIASGLARAHAAGVLHRDLKPANVFLHQVDEPTGTGDSGYTLVKIVDFGIAKLIGDAASDPRDAQPLTSFGQTMGTPQYMAPEQVQGYPFDHRVDLWALGALLYEMLAGRPAYALLPTFQETAVAIVTQSPPPLSEVAPWVPPSVAEVVDRALDHDQNRRTPDAAAFAEALVAAMPGAFVEPRARARAAQTPMLPRAPTRSSGASIPPVSVPPSSAEPRSESPAAVPAPPPPSSRRLELVLEEPAPPARGRRGVAIAIVVALLLLGSALLAVAALRAHTTRGATPATPGEPTSLSSTPQKKQAIAPEHATLEEAPSSSAPPAVSAPPLGSAAAGKPKLPAPATPSFGGAGLSTSYE